VLRIEDLSDDEIRLVAAMALRGARLQLIEAAIQTGREPVKMRDTVDVLTFINMEDPK
jgi:hypothetical protein